MTVGGVGDKDGRNYSISGYPISVILVEPDQFN